MAQGHNPHVALSINSHCRAFAGEMKTSAEREVHSRERLPPYQITYKYAKLSERVGALLVCIGCMNSGH